MNEEMTKERDHSLLRPVVFANLKVGDKLVSREGLVTVAYMGPNFAVLRHTDGIESTPSDGYLERIFRFQPLCWVEGKPVYPGDVLYYKYDPTWQYNDEGVVALAMRYDTLLFKGGQEFHNVSDATWTKPEQKRVPSFQVEGQDVFPGDTVYYYGDDKYMWGREMIVEKDSCVNGVHAESFAKGAATFRLKPMLVIGDHLVPMPVRDAAEMKDGDYYYIPCLDNDTGYLSHAWSNHSFDFEVCDKGLVQRTKEAASAHGEALIALSKKKD